jgi:ATP-dependent helicase/nuclease subunit B
MSTGPLAGPSPRWLTIPAHRPFLDDLAEGLLAELSGEDLAEAVVLLPSRRSAGALIDAFLKASGGKALLLPQIRALGDLEEGEPPFEPGELALDLPAAIDPYRRRFELARLVSEKHHLLGRSLDAAAALELADALAAFLDSVEIEEVDDAGRLDRIRSLAPETLAKHWQISAEFLAVALEAWPRRLAELGLIDVATRRVKLLRALAESWRRRPPAAPLIAAGSTGTAPANADLLAAIAGLPRGAVVLPGLDLELAEAAWAEVGEQHPQGAMKRLLERAGVERADVRGWPASGGASQGRWRRRIINEALRPPESTRDWRDQIARLNAEAGADDIDPVAAGLEGLQVQAARTEEEAAAMAALLMRETLEKPGKTCALITPDQGLARRVAARLSRWGIEVDSSAGAPLPDSPVGVLALLVAHAVGDPEDPVALLAVLKHPLVRLGLDAAALSRARGFLERYALRGPRGAEPGWIERKLKLAASPREGEDPSSAAERNERTAEALGLLAGVQTAQQLASAPYDGGGAAAPAAAARGLAQAMEALASGAEVGGALWAGPDGEAAAGLLSGLIHQSEGLPPATPTSFARLLDGLMQGVTVRAARRTHPRLKILGAIESRLVSADRLILAGLEEGVWPQGAPTDPFLSRPMRAAFGLPPPERRIGLSAHDFAQAACAHEVVLLHAERREGAPATPSRWLWRLSILAKGAGKALPGRSELADWARSLDLPGPFRPAERPRPRPPVETRPVELPVTGVETWLRDPYAIYARYVLRLRALHRPDEPVEARARGEAVHRALQRFTELHPDELPEDAQAQLQALLLEALVEAGMPVAAMAREGALAAEAASWLAAFEARRRRGARILVEQKGELSFGVGAGRFKVTARADRLEQRGRLVDVLDFKTGSPPTARQVETHFAPQLTLTAAILEGGGFPGIDHALAGELLYVQVSGRRSQKPPRPVAIAGESSQLAEQALAGLKRRAGQFALPETAYPSWVAPQYMSEWGGDYDHLARVWEWHVLGEDEEGAP